jgi:hypothetical protein
MHPDNHASIIFSSSSQVRIPSRAHPHQILHVGALHFALLAIKTRPAWPHHLIQRAMDGRDMIRSINEILSFNPTVCLLVVPTSLRHYLISDL